MTHSPAKSDDLGAIHPDAEAVASGLSKTLADTFALYVKTLNYHWNVQGSKFVGVHKLTEEQYQNLAESIDNIAERIRMIGYFAPGSLADFAGLTSIEEAKADGIHQEKLISNLERDHMQMVGTLKEVIQVAEKADDSSTVDLLSERRQFHEEAAWMLRSMSK